MHCFMLTSDESESKVKVLIEAARKLKLEVVIVRSASAILEDSILVSSKNSLIIITDKVLDQSTWNSEILKLASVAKGIAFVLYVADEISPTNYKKLLATGSGDSVPWSQSVSELGKISRQLESGELLQHVETANRAPALVHVFMGSSGGVGATTLALEVAAFAAKNSRESSHSALIDLSFRRNSISDYVDLVPRLNLHEIDQNPERLDTYMLDIFAAEHPLGFDLFASDDATIDNAAPSENTVYALLNLIIEKYNTVCVDLPGVHYPWAIEILRNSDQINIVGQYNIPSAHQMIRTRKFLSGQGIQNEKMHFIINKIPHSIFGQPIRQSNLDEVLAGSTIKYVRDGGLKAIDAINYGQLMTELYPGNRMSRDILDLAKSMSPKAARSWFKRQEGK